MPAIFKAYRIKIQHPNDVMGIGPEGPIKNEFQIFFYPGGFHLVLIDLAMPPSQMTIKNLIINSTVDEVVHGYNDQYNVKIIYKTGGETINKIIIKDLSSFFIHEYLGENELTKTATAEIRKQYVIGANKTSKTITYFIEEGYFSPLEVDFAFTKIRQKLAEIRYLDYSSSDDGSLRITVSFFKDSSTPAHVDIEYMGFDFESIKTVVQDAYNNPQRV